jgi:hypothetical protein
MKKMLILTMTIPITLFAKTPSIDHCLNMEDQRFLTTKLVMTYEYCKKNKNDKDCSPSKMNLLREKIREQIHQTKENQSSFEKCKSIL